MRRRDERSLVLEESDPDDTVNQSRRWLRLDTRAMRHALGFEPVWTSEEAFRAFVDRDAPMGEVEVA